MKESHTDFSIPLDDEIDATTSVQRFNAISPYVFGNTHLYMEEGLARQEILPLIEAFLKENRFHGSYILHEVPGSLLGMLDIDELEDSRGEYKSCVFNVYE